jgi:hypothetical protein
MNCEQSNTFQYRKQLFPIPFLKCFLLPSCCFFLKNELNNGESNAANVDVIIHGIERISSNQNQFKVIHTFFRSSIGSFTHL